MLHHLKLVCLALLTHAVFATKYEGDSCIDAYTNTVGKCAVVETCMSAIEDFQSNGIRPTPCETGNNYLVCCRDGTTILDTPDQNRGSSEGSNSKPNSGSNRPNQGSNKPNQGSNTSSSRPTVTQTPNNRYGSNRGGGIISRKKCQEYSRAVTETVVYFALVLNPNKMTITAPKCDYTGTELIVGGEDAKQGEFPHMAAIGWPNFNGGYNFDCGGSLISKLYVLTAAHCTSSTSTDVSDRLPAIVRLGDQNLNPKVRDKANPIEVPIRNIVKHPDYSPPKRYNDIALLELSSEVEFNKDIRPACLWVEPDVGNNVRAIATGWGVNNTETGRKTDELQKVSLTLMDSAVCNETLSNLQNRYWRHGFDETQLCAGETRQGRDTCQGDSGSPLQVVAEDNQCIFKIMGITSFGPRICGNNPAVYTRVSSYISWIESIVWPQN